VYPLFAYGLIMDMKTLPIFFLTADRFFVPAHCLRLTAHQFYSLLSAHLS
jgi:hypothetical protein